MHTITIDLKKMDIQDQLSESGDKEDRNLQTSEDNVQCQIPNDLEMMSNPTDKEIKYLHDKSLHQAKRILNKMEKVSIDRTS